MVCCGGGGSSGVCVAIGYYLGGVFLLRGAAPYPLQGFFSSSSVHSSIYLVWVGWCSTTQYSNGFITDFGSAFVSFPARVQADT